MNEDLIFNFLKDLSKLKRKYHVEFNIVSMDGKDFNQDYEISAMIKGGDSVRLKIVCSLLPYER
jgi:hypothetical protein